MTAEASLGVDAAGLFDELLKDIPALPTVPKDLEEFDRPISPNEARFEGFLAFLHVHRSNLAGTQLRDRLVAHRPACDSADPRGTRDSRGRVILLPGEKEAAFNADYPHPDDYPDPVSNFDYQLALRETEIGVAHAKRICMTLCPLQRVCLASSLVEWTPAMAFALAKEHAREMEKSAGAQHFTFEDFSMSTETVRGGWGPGARAKIERSFHHWRRRYEQSALKLGHEAECVDAQSQTVEEIDWPRFTREPLRGDLNIKQLTTIDRLASVLKM
jgi:hypothetical protein